MRRRVFMTSAVTLGIASALPALRAQQRTYPTKPITFVVPFAAGGGGDVVARLLAKSLSERINNPVIVDNKIGAGGSIGSAYVLRSPPDGYTLLNMSSTYPIQAAVTKVPFDPLADMQPIVMISRDPAIILVNNSSPVKTTKDLVDAATREPGKLTYGSAGIGSLGHLGMEELAFLLNIRLTHVPYKGSSQAFNDLLSGSIDMMLTGTTFSKAHIAGGKVRAIGIAGNKRSPSLPDVPTFAEQGYQGYDVVDWKAIAGPKGMPPDVVAFLNKELNEVLKQKSVSEKFEAEGASSIGGTPEQMMQTVRADIERWKNVAQKANVKVE